MITEDREGALRVLQGVQETMCDLRDKVSPFLEGDAMLEKDFYLVLRGFRDIRERLEKRLGHPVEGRISDS